VGVVGGDARARARSQIFTDEAVNFARELAQIAGHDPDCLPPAWVSAGPIYRVQMMLDAGWRIEVMRDAARAVMARKHDGPPSTIRYFERVFARAHAPQLPLPAADATAHKEALHVPAVATNWQQSRDAWRAARARFRAGLDAAD